MHASTQHTRSGPARTWSLTLACAIVALAAPVAAAQTGLEFTPQTFQRFVGRSHAILVHFPIAMVIVAATLEVLTALRSRFRPSSAPLVSPTGLTCLSFGALGAIAASVAGWLNADAEGVGSADQATLFWHRWLGITVSAIAALAVIAGLIARAGRMAPALAAYRAAIVLAALLVGFTGHLGGSMVYGDGYLLAAFEVDRPAPPPAQPPATEPVLAANQPSEAPRPSAPVIDPALAASVQSILDRACIECHGKRRQKGDLRLDSLAIVGGHQAVIPGDPDASELIRRVTLPEDDDDFMPQDDPPLAAAEIDTLRAWIAALGGAEFTPTVAVAPAQSGTDQRAAADDAPADPSSGPAASQPAVTAVTLAPVTDIKLDLTPQQREACRRAVDAIRGAGAYAAPLSTSGDLVHANFAMLGKACTDQSLELLAGLEPVLVEVNLAGTAVTDAGIKTLQRFTALERINLGRTAITDTGVEHLAVLPRLALLNLHATAVTDRSLDAMTAMPSLRRAYLWRTSTTPEGVSRLSSGRTDLRLELGAAVAQAPAPDQQAAAPAPVSPPASDQPASDPPAAAPDPPAAVAAAKPGCCAKAESEGRLCDHPCCVEARAAGKVCQKCLGN
ncbi:MAG: hypothetical protein AMXMBFR58_21140 [Phycisphaerae bacterium]